MSRAKRKDRDPQAEPAAASDPSPASARLAERSPAPGTAPLAEPDPRGGLASRLRPVLLVLAAQAAFLAIVFIVAVSGSPPPRLRATDAVALPGGDAVLRVRIEREDPPFPALDPLQGTIVLFERLGDDPTGAAVPVGSAAIDASGAAELHLDAPATPGLHRFRARIDAAGAEKVGADVLVSVIPPERGLLLVVLPSAPGESRFFAEGEGPDGSGNAAAVLAGLARDRPIIYLARTALPGHAWIATHGLPPGPILAPERGAPWGIARLIAALDLSRWKGSHRGVAASLEDAAPLSLAGVRVALLGGSDGAAAGPLIRPAARWSDAARILQESG